MFITTAYARTIRSAVPPVRTGRVLSAPPPCNDRVAVAAQAPAGDEAEACLQLHVTLRDTPLRLRLWATVRRWVGLLQGRSLDPGPLGVDVQVLDLRGQPVLKVRSASRLLDLPLPAGTFDVRVQHGERRRRYTLTLLPGVPARLHVYFTNPAA